MRIYISTQWALVTLGVTISGITQEETVIFTDDKCYVNDISLQTVATNSNWYSKHFYGLTKWSLSPNLPNISKRTQKVTLSTNGEKSFSGLDCLWY